MKTFLHVGCGPKRKDQTTRGFISIDWHELRLDIDKSVQPDIIGTMTDMSAVADASVDAIFSSHNIEHLYPHEVPLALAEFKRVLRPDGFAVITCPDLLNLNWLVRTISRFEWKSWSLQPSTLTIACGTPLDQG